MTSFKDPAEQARNAQRLADEQRRLNQQRDVGSISQAQDAQRSRQLAADRIGHTLATEALGEQLKADRLALEAKMEAEGWAVADQAIRDSNARTRLGGIQDQDDWKRMQQRKESDFLGPVVGIPPLTQLMAVPYKRIASDSNRSDMHFRRTLVWLESEWQGTPLRNLHFSVMDVDRPNPIQTWLRALPEGVPIPLRVLGEREPSRWNQIDSLLAGKAYILALAGFQAKVQMGDTFEVKVAHGDLNSTKGYYKSPEGEDVLITIAHHGGHPAVKGLFGLKNKQGKCFQARVARIGLRNAREMEITWEFAPKASFR